MRSFVVLIFALALIPVAARAEIKTVPLPPPAHRPTHVAAAVDQATPVMRPDELTSAVTLADIGFANGLRLSNLGGHQELFVPLPQDGLVTASELVLVLDDLSAYDAKRNLEVQANDRTVAAIALDGKSRGRVVRIPLAGMRPKDGYIKLLFLYSGAATLDRCIDVRYVGDSLTVRPESAIEVAIGATGSLDVATTAMLMPREAAIVLPSRRVTENEIATAVTVARSLISSGRRVSFYHGYEAAAELAKRDGTGRWARGIVLIGPLAEVASIVDSPLARVAGPAQPLGTLAAVRIGGMPALLVSDNNAVSAGRLFASPLRAATRGMGRASVGDSGPSDLPTDSVTFEQLAVPTAEAEVFGRANLTTVIDVRKLPPETRPARLLLNVMVAPDGAGEKAVVSTFVNDRLLGSTVAAIGEPTHLDLALPPGLFGSIANVRALVQRDSAQGDCRFEAQGYPAQILGSSALALAGADGKPHDFPDLTAHFVRGVRLIVPASAADQPIAILGILAQLTNQLTADVAPVSVVFTANTGAPVPDAPFIAIGDRPPSGTKPRVHFDRGRVEVTDRSGRTLLNLGGFAAGAVAQLVTAGDYPGLWIKPLAADGSAPYPAGLWLFATAALLFFLQRLFRRRAARTSE